MDGRICVVPAEVNEAGSHLILRTRISEPYVRRNGTAASAAPRISASRVHFADRFRYRDAGCLLLVRMAEATSTPVSDSRSRGDCRDRGNSGWLPVAMKLGLIAMSG